MAFDGNLQQIFLPVMMWSQRTRSLEEGDKLGVNDFGRGADPQSMKRVKWSPEFLPLSDEFKGEVQRVVPRPARIDNRVLNQLETGHEAFLRPLGSFTIIRRSPRRKRIKHRNCTQRNK